MATQQYLLRADSNHSQEPGHWHFALQDIDGRSQVEVEDAEPAVQGERLELLTVIRGLEAIDHPAHVTLLTSSDYVRRGIKYGLDDWRSSGWLWERHGQMVPVKNADLWRRLDRAMQFHTVTCSQTSAANTYENSPSRRRSA
jgi:ribonuclease HI